MREYDSELIDSFHYGTHLVMCYSGGRSTRFDVDPAWAPMIAAGRYAEDAISRSIMEQSHLRPSTKKPLTKAQQQAWNSLCEAMGNETYPLEYCSYREAAEAGVAAMQQEAERLLKNPVVRSAYEQFMLLCELSKSQEDQK